MISLVKKNKKTTLAILLALTFSNPSHSHTDSLGWTIAPGASSGLYLVDIFYGTWHTGSVGAEGGLNLVGTAGAALTQNFNQTQPFSIYSTSNNPSAPLPTGLTLGTNYFYPNTSTPLVDNDFTSSGSRTIYGFQVSHFIDIPEGTYSFGYAAGSLTVVWTPSDPSINAGVFTIGSGGTITVVGAPSSIPNIESGNNGSDGFNALSALTTGTSSNFYNRFAGGTLKADVSTGTSANPYVTSASFSITTGANQAFIDQNGNYTKFVGQFTDDTSNGHLIIQNSAGTAGKVILAPTAVGGNTYTGGTEVQAGATLSISNPNAIGSGGLDLIGSLTVAATLETTESMTIANHITVTGDPVFSVASGTTTTVSTAITGTGDVVVSGGGTLALSAVNTYTGLTAVDASSTLALTGSGSITPSSALNNSGNVDVRGANGNVALGGTFTQGSTGSLLMNISPTNNQKVLVTGAATLAGNLTLTASSGTYSTGRYTLLTANGVTGKFDSLLSNLPTYTRLGYTLGYDANDVYLILTPNVGDTQQSLVNTAAALQNTYTLQNSVLANSFYYDCNLFDVNNICVSAGGRNTAIQAANGLNNTSALLIASYRLDENNSRIGAYADQNLSVNNGGSTVNLGNNTPLIGLFAAWSQRPDGTGAEVKAGIAYGQKNTTITRQVVGTSEPGSGSSQLNSQGAQLTAKYGFGVMENVIVSPYIGMRYTQNNMGGYSEAASPSVTSPLTYSALNTNATTALAGVGASYRFIPRATVFGSAGVETDTNTANGTYAATGLTGLTPVNFNPNPVKTRPTATIGATYDVEKNQRIGITGIYRQEPFQAVSSTTVMATYTVGL